MNLIDRDKLIERAEEIIDIGNDFYSESKDKKDAFEHGVKTLKLAIKDEPTVNEWIPVERELPEKDGGYIVAQEVYSISQPQKLLKMETTTANFFNGRFMKNKYHKVIAWMPIPTYEVNND